MAKTRFLQAQTVKMVSSPADWERLARQAIAQAELAGDSRAQAIRNAIQAGVADKVLKRMGIIGETDIRREFPTRET
jgi:hypothetical protein